MRWVGLVRNIMLGREGIDRAGLIAIVEAAGGRRVRSHLTTGNVTFDADPDRIGMLADRVQVALQRLLLRDAMIAIRPHDWLCRFVDASPFGGFEPADWELEVGFLAHTAPPLKRSMLPAAGRTQIVAAHDREVATARPRSGPDRPHVNRLLEVASGQPATARGWSTLCRIAAA